MVGAGNRLLTQAEIVGEFLGPPRPTISLGSQRLDSPMPCPGSPCLAVRIHVLFSNSRRDWRALRECFQSQARDRWEWVWERKVAAPVGGFESSSSQGGGDDF